MLMTGKTVLIVDDEAPIREMIAVALEMADYDYLEAADAREAHALIVDKQPDLILLDWMLPGTSGVELARRLKKEEATAEIPIIMLTAKVEEDNKIQGLEVGADDYITKPFSPREVVARVKAVLRRANPQQDSSAPTLTLDEERYEAVMGSQRVALTAIEFALLATLARHPGRIWSRDQLMDEIYQDHRVVSDRTIDSHIRKLRRKLSDGDDASHDWIGSVYGVGYRLEQP